MRKGVNMNIFLLRHGETDWNQEQRLQGHMDIPLNQNGRAQINHAAEILSDLHPGIDLMPTNSPGRISKLTSSSTFSGLFLK